MPHMQPEVVVIEPAEADRYWLRMILNESRIEHTLQEFPSAVAALDTLAAPAVRRIDFVLINVKPPLFDVGEAVSRLSSLPALSAARFGVMILDDSELRRVPAGCKPILKPVTVESIQELLLGKETPA
jgi:hypothetical protein